MINGESYKVIVAEAAKNALGMENIYERVFIVKLLTEGLNDAVGATFAVEPDPEKAAVLIRAHIEGKRKKLGLPHAPV
jgi:hydroxylamine reductase (hybrid-cluster protein)